MIGQQPRLEVAASRGDSVGVLAFEGLIGQQPCLDVAAWRLIELLGSLNDARHSPKHGDLVGMSAFGGSMKQQPQLEVLAWRMRNQLLHSWYVTAISPKTWQAPGLIGW